MRRLLTAAGTAILSALTAQAQCPDDGRVVVFHPDQGYRFIRFFGNDTVEGFFPGSTFKWIEPDEHNPEPRFWIDGLFVEWMFVDRQSFMPIGAASPSAELDAYYTYETNYLAQECKKDPSRLHLKRFAFKTNKSPDAKVHEFLIWQATPGMNDDTTLQYWVATVHPKGVMTMSLVVRKPEDAAKAKILIDSYMADYHLLSAEQREFAWKEASKPIRPKS